MTERRWQWGGIGLALSVLLAVPARAEQPMAIDLTYDSVMNMVRPEALPDIHVHHDLHVTIGADGSIREDRDRNAGRYADQNAMRQAPSDPSAAYVTWRRDVDGSLVRVQNDPQSVRTMIVTLLPGHACRLDVADRLKAGFTEYKFLRIKNHTMAYYSTYRVAATRCRIR